MSLFRKPLLYFHTLRYLKWIQIWRRLTFKLYHPVPDLSPAPPVAECSIDTIFPIMPPCYSGADRFRFLNEERTFTGWNDSARDKLWLYNLHYFDWLRQESVMEEEGNRWIAKWIAENPPPAGNGWEPYPLSLRIVNWIKWHWSGHSLSEDARQSLAVQVRFLMKRLEYHLLANHLLVNARALVFAGCFFSGPEAGKWLAKGLEIYREQLPEQILADGGHFELSPMYQCIILENLLDLRNIHAPLELDDVIRRMFHWLAVMTGPDGRIALFNDAAYGFSLTPAELQCYGERLGFKTEHVNGSEDLPQSGYSRLQPDNDIVCICDTGDIGPSYQPGHAHADALSFELWLKGRKVLTNCGTGRYFNSPERRFQRSSAAHNTLTIDGLSSSEMWSAHRVARRGRLLSRSFQADQCGGAFRTWFGITHARTWRIENGGILTITDHVSGKGTHLLSFMFHPLASDLKISSEPAFPRKEVDAPYSPEFGVFESQKNMAFEKKVDLPVTIKFNIS